MASVCSRLVTVSDILCNSGDYQRFRRCLLAKSLVSTKPSCCSAIMHTYTRIEAISTTDNGQNVIGRSATGRPPNFVLCSVSRKLTYSTSCSRYAGTRYTRKMVLVVVLVVVVFVVVVLLLLLLLLGCGYGCGCGCCCCCCCWWWWSWWWWWWWLCWWWLCWWW